MARFRSFPVRLPSGVRYWTVIGPDYRPVTEVDDYLLHSRLGADAAESTSQSYATALALFLEWTSSLGKDWREVSPHLGRFVFWLRYYNGTSRSDACGDPVRGARRVNAVMSAVRSFFRYMAATGEVPKSVLGALYDELLAYSPDLGEQYERAAHLKARHALKEPKSTVDNATDDEVIRLLSAAGTARDRFLVIAMWRMGLRRGELVGMRREDVHFVADATRLGCGFKGPHVHVVRRDNPNRAFAKSHHPRVVPADWISVQAYDQYLTERTRSASAERSDFLMVNLFRAPVGQPMRPSSLNETLARLSAKGGCDRTIRPHMLRHSFSTNTVAAGATLDILKELLGHAWITSTEVYLHVSADRLRDAVDNVPNPIVAHQDERRMR
jgi:integrase/recombinase XerD